MSLEDHPCHSTFKYDLKARKPKDRHTGSSPAPAAASGSTDPQGVIGLLASVIKNMIPTVNSGTQPVQIPGTSGSKKRSASPAPLSLSPPYTTENDLVYSIKGYLPNAPFSDELQNVLSMLFKGHYIADFRMISPDVTARETLMEWGIPDGVITCLYSVTAKRVRAINCARRITARVN